MGQIQLRGNKMEKRRGSRRGKKRKPRKNAQRLGVEVGPLLPDALGRCGDGLVADEQIDVTEDGGNLEDEDRAGIREGRRV